MSPSARELAVRSLEHWLSLTHPGEAGNSLDYRRGLTTALVELGVLEPEDQGHWTARFEAAGRPLEPPGAELHARAVELLERELSDAAKPQAKAGDSLGPRERFTTMLQALLETGIVGWDKRAGFLERLDAVAPETSTRPRGPTYRLAELQAVVVGPDLRLNGLRVNSAELYSDCAIVRWHLVADGNGDWRDHLSIPDRANDLMRAHAPTSLQDELGTAYTLEPPMFLTMPDALHLNQQPEVLPGASAFTPAVPKEATRLSIGLPAGQVHIDLHESS
jgi:hypothetical protein